MQLIKEYVNHKKEELKQGFLSLGSKVKLVIIQVKDNPASNAYIKGKLKDCTEVGADAELMKFADGIEEKELLELIDKLNNDDSVTGIIVQLPLPYNIDERKVSLAISPSKDVDGFHPMSFYTPATPTGILTYLEDNNFEFKGRNALIIGRSEIVGKPMAKMLLNKDMNVTVVHSKTKAEDLSRYIENSDLIIVSTGKAHFIDNRFNFKKDAVVVDVGISRNAENKLEGDCVPGLNVAFQTPVPGGVGLLTRVALLINLYKGGCNKNGI